MLYRRYLCLKQIEYLMYIYIVTVTPLLFPSKRVREGFIKIRNMLEFR